MPEPVVLSLALALTRLLLRFHGQSSAADAVEDGQSLLGGARRLVDARKAPPLQQAVTQALTARIAGLEDPSRRQELTIAAQNVADLIDAASRDDAAVLAAATDPTGFYRWLRLHYGNRLLAATEEAATSFTDDLMRATSEVFAELAPSSERFLPAAALHLMETTSAIHAGVEALIERSDRRAATGTLDQRGPAAHVPTLPLVQDLSPGDAGVHPSIAPRGQNGLPPYLPRSHDLQLREALLTSRDTGTSTSIAVVGTSCTGKSRAVYEALLDLLPEWTAIRAHSARDLLDTLEAGAPRRSVVVLDELERFLPLTEDGVAVAARLDQLLRDEDALVVVVATIWPTYLDALAKPPTPSEARAGAALTRRFVTGFQTRVVVPEGFSDQELRLALETLPARGSESTALELAIDTAPTVTVGHTAVRCLTQVLAGGTQLVDKVFPRHPSSSSFTPAARALLLCAADLRLAGVHDAIPRWLIEQAVPHYVDPRVRADLDPSRWIDEALEEVTRAARESNPNVGDHSHDVYLSGVPALRPEWSTDPRDRAPHLLGYRLHDYLFQHHRRGSGARSEPPGLRRTLLERSTLDRLPQQVVRSIGWEAAARADADAVARIAPLVSDPIAGFHLLVRSAPFEQAVDFLGPHAATSRDAAVVLARALEQAGRDDDALRALEPFLGTQEGGCTAARILVRRRRLAEAERVLVPLADRSLDCAIALSDVLAEQGRLADALEVLIGWGATAGGASALLRLAARNYGLPLPAEVYERLGATDSRVVVEVARALRRRGGEEDELRALELLSDAAHSTPEAALVLADILTSRGREEDAIDLLQRAAHEYDHAAVRRAVLSLQVGRTDDAIADLSRWSSRSQAASLHLTDVYVGQGRPEKAVEMLFEPSRRFSQSAVRRASINLELGRVDDAVADLTRWASVSQEAALLLADLHVDSGELDEALLVLEQPAARLNQCAERRADLLRRVGRLDEALAAVQPHVERHSAAKLSAAMTLARLGEAERALELLRRLSAQGSFGYLQACAAVSPLVAESHHGPAELDVPSVVEDVCLLLDRTTAARRIRPVLQSWMDERTTPLGTAPSIVVSLLDCYETLTAGHAEPSRRVFSHLCDMAQGTRRAYEAFSRLVPGSPVAQRVLDEVLAPCD